MKKRDFSTAEAAITLCHVTRESRSKAFVVFSCQNNEVPFGILQLLRTAGFSGSGRN